MNDKGWGQNLVNNPSFENFTACPHTVGEVNKCTGWRSFGNSSDYFNACDTLIVDVPHNAMGFQFPSTGNGYCGLYNYDPSGYREYLGTQLDDSLLINIKYFVSFEVVLANYHPCQSNKIGCLFSTIQYYDSLPPQKNNFAHIFSQNFITDTLNWIKIKGSFIADSNYKYIVIGNFFDNSNTDTINCGPAGSATYLFIENVCVSSDSVQCDLSNYIGKNSDTDVVIVYPNPTKNNFIIQSNSENNIINNIIIYDSFLNPIKFSAIPENTKRIYIDLLNINPGIYFLNIIKRNNKIQNIKVIVN